MNMHTTSTIGVPSRRIHLHLSSEMNETLYLHPAHSLILGICIVIMMGIVGLLSYSAAENFTMSPPTYSASVTVQAGTIYVIKSTTGEQPRLGIHDTLLLDEGDRVVAHGGEAIITFFDGSDRRVSGTTYTFENSTELLEPRISKPRQWMQQMWRPSADNPRRTNNAASVLG